MKLSPIVLRLRASETYFGNMIAGAIEMDTAMRNTLSQEIAFVVDLGDVVTKNIGADSVIQKLDEKFGVICAVKNDSDLSERTGILAYDIINDVKMELIKSLVGWHMGADGSYENADNVIEYAGSRLLDVNNGYVWYQFEFIVPTVIESFYYLYQDEDTLEFRQPETIEEEQVVASQVSGNVEMVQANLSTLNKIWTQFMNPDKYPGRGKLEDNIPVDTSLIDMESLITKDDNPYNGAFGKGYGLSYYLYRGE